MPKRILRGTVVSDKGDKTCVVLVERRVMHPLYKKFIRQSKKYMAHDENNLAKTGETVTIRECRPISARKRWELVTSAEDTSGTTKSGKSATTGKSGKAA